MHVSIDKVNYLLCTFSRHYSIRVILEEIILLGSETVVALSYEIKSISQCVTLSTWWSPWIHSGSKFLDYYILCHAQQEKGIRIDGWSQILMWGSCMHLPTLSLPTKHGYLDCSAMISTKAIMRSILACHRNPIIKRRPRQRIPDS